MQGKQVDMQNAINFSFFQFSEAQNLQRFAPFPEEDILRNFQIFLQ